MEFGSVVHLCLFMFAFLKRSPQAPTMSGAEQTLATALVAVRTRSDHDLVQGYDEWHGMTRKIKRLGSMAKLYIYIHIHIKSYKFIKSYQGSYVNRHQSEQFLPSSSRERQRVGATWLGAVPEVLPSNEAPWGPPHNKSHKLPNNPNIVHLWFKLCYGIFWKYEKLSPIVCFQSPLLPPMSTIIESIYPPGPVVASQPKYRPPAATLGQISTSRYHLLAKGLHPAGSLERRHNHRETSWHERLWTFYGGDSVWKINSLKMFKLMNILPHCDMVVGRISRISAVSNRWQDVTGCDRRGSRGSGWSVPCRHGHWEVPRSPLISRTYGCLAVLLYEAHDLQGAMMRNGRSMDWSR